MTDDDIIKRRLEIAKLLREEVTTPLNNARMHNIPCDYDKVFEREHELMEEYKSLGLTSKERQESEMRT
ncbi:MAG: hypothetical protein ACI4SO_07580 [Muribaculaceae bacterium]